MNRKPFTKLPHNARVEDFLAANGLPGVTAKWLSDGPLKNRFMLTGYELRPDGRQNRFKAPIKWSQELGDKMTSLGFLNYWGQPFGPMDGNGGQFSVCVVAPAGLDPRNVGEVG